MDVKRVKSDDLLIVLCEQSGTKGALWQGRSASHRCLTLFGWTSFHYHRHSDSEFDQWPAASDALTLVFHSARYRICSLPLTSLHQKTCSWSPISFNHRRISSCIGFSRRISSKRRRPGVCFSLFRRALHGGKSLLGKQCV